MTELPAKAGSEGYAACDDGGGLYNQKKALEGLFLKVSGKAPESLPQFIPPVLWTGRDGLNLCHALALTQAARRTRLARLPP